MYLISEKFRPDSTAVALAFASATRITPGMLLLLCHLQASTLTTAYMPIPPRPIQDFTDWILPPSHAAVIGSVLPPEDGVNFDMQQQHQVDKLRLLALQAVEYFLNSMEHTPRFNNHAKNFKFSHQQRPS